MNCIERIKSCCVDLKSNDYKYEDYHVKNMVIYQNKITNLNECIICLEDMKYNEDLILVKCSHIYHKECLEKWMVRRSVCPLCNIKI